MKFYLRILCDCGRTTEYLLKRTTNRLVDSGKIYEDYTSISDSLEDRGGDFDATVHPEGNIIKCKHCGSKHDLTI